MKILTILIMLCINGLYGCEVLISIIDKVSQSDVIVVATVIDIHDNGVRNNKKEIVIGFNIENVIKGNIKSDFSVNAQTSSYELNGIIYSRTAGWSDYKLNIGNRYVLYLYKNTDYYKLIEDSNQYMELIDDGSVIANDIDPNMDFISLNSKIDAISNLIKSVRPTR